MKKILHPLWAAFWGTAILMVVTLLAEYFCELSGAAFLPGISDGLSYIMLASLVALGIMEKRWYSGRARQEEPRYLTLIRTGAQITAGIALAVMLVSLLLRAE